MRMMNPLLPWRPLRESLGLSLREVARRTGINPGRLSIIERGVPASPDEAERLRRALTAEVLAGQKEG